MVIDHGETSELSPAESLASAGVDPVRARRVELLQAAGVISPWSVPAEDRGGDGAEPRDFHTVILLGHDEETVQPLQAHLLRERAADLVDGLRVLRDVAPRAEVVLTVDAAAADWARAAFGDAVRIHPVPRRYERRLVRLLVPELTGLHPPADASLHGAGVAVVSTENVLAVREALDGRPCLDKRLVVSGSGLADPHLLRVPLGTPVGDVLVACGVDPAGAARILAGGPMRGAALQSAATPVDKFVNGIHVMEESDLPPAEVRHCVTCGRCTRVCPVGLQVHMIGRCVEFDQFEEARALHPEVCIHCGLCATVCPAHRPLVQMVHLAATDPRRTL